MIDIESVVFAKVSTELRAKFPNIFVTGEYVAAPAKFPAVSLIQMDNPIHEPSKTLSSIENAVYPMFTASIYSNLQTGKKSQAKAIAAAVADVMSSLGFTRTYNAPVTNADPGIYRVEQRYRKIAEKGQIR